MIFGGARHLCSSPCGAAGRGGEGASGNKCKICNNIANLTILRLIGRAAAAQVFCIMVQTLFVDGFAGVDGASLKFHNFTAKKRRMVCAGVRHCQRWV